MNDLDILLNKNRREVNNLYRHYKVTGSNDLEKIRSGYENQGQNFMMKLLEIIVPKDHFSNYTTTLLEPRMATPDLIGLQQSTTVPLSIDTSTAKPKTWAFWDNFLGAVASTGKTIGGVMADINNPQSQATPEQQAQAYQLAAQEKKNTNTIYIAAGALLVIILVVLILKK